MAVADFCYNIRDLYIVIRYVDRPIAILMTVVTGCVNQQKILITNLMKQVASVVLHELIDILISYMIPIVVFYARINPRINQFFGTYSKLSCSYTGKYLLW